MTIDVKQDIVIKQKTHMCTDNHLFHFNNTTFTRILIGLLMLLLIVVPSTIKAQIFVELPKHGPGMAEAEAVWISSGGKLHPIVSGDSKAGASGIRTIFLKQTSKNTFSPSTTSLPNFIHGSMDVADFDKNGLEDVVLTGMGANNQPISGIWLQKSNGVFQRSPITIPALMDGSVQFADFDKDGDFDVLIAGQDASGTFQTRIFRNNNGQLSDINAKLPGIRFGKAIWGDANKDGLLDLLIVGQTEKGTMTRLYVNKNNAFTMMPQKFPGLKHSTAAWADFNNDGHMDIILAGESSGGMPYTRVFYGNQEMRFIEANSSVIRQLMNATIDVGDFNRDQYIDFVITGESLERPYTIVYENQKGKGFRDLMAGLPGVSSGIARWGDYDKDGDLDLYIAGVDVCYQLISSVFRNTIDAPYDDEPYVEAIPMELSRGPYYYFVFSSCYCDPEGLGKKSYNAFVSNIHKETVDFDLTYKFNDLLISRFPGWNWSDRGHRTSNAFTSIKDAEEGRKTVIGGYVNDGFKLHYMNW